MVNVNHNCKANTFLWCVKTAFFVLVMLQLPNSKIALANATSNIQYQISTADINNPGRGFYHPYATLTSSFVALSQQELSNLRQNYKVPDGGNYAVRHTLILRQYILDTYATNEVLDSALLAAIAADFEVARNAGVKVIVRFSYNNTPPTGDCGAWICPPYGDASKEVVLAHIDQLSKVLTDNHDVLYAWQAGFIGTWGEMMFTDHFGDYDTQGRIFDENWNDRNEMVTAILNAVPKTIPVQVRKPQLIQKYMHGAKAPITVSPLLAKFAHNGSNNARLGLYNDCFLATADDWGTFADYGSSNHPPVNNDQVIETLKQHQSAHSNFTLVGGETCDDAYSPQNDCSNNVLGIMDRFNYSYLNSGYNNLVNNDWEDENCMADIKKRLGYRLHIERGTFPDTGIAGKPINLKMSIRNSGFTSPMFPMTINIILIHDETKRQVVLPIVGENTDIRHWRPELKIELSTTLMLPSDIDAGNYRLWIQISDTSNNGVIANRPEYSIQLANINTWNSETGFNDLLHSFVVN